MEPALGAAHSVLAPSTMLKPLPVNKGQKFKPLSQVCEYLNALHVYTDEARQGKTRTVEANHFCTQVTKDLRQCLIYDSNSTSARLIGVEYMVPKHVYETFPEEERKLWHSHEFEVKSGMLIFPHPGIDDDSSTVSKTLSGMVSEEEGNWEKIEKEAVKEVVGLYGKTWHFWQVDRGDEYPFGMPTLMGSLTHGSQADLKSVLKDRDERYNVSYEEKAKQRADIELPGVHQDADSWWKA